MWGDPTMNHEKHLALISVVSIVAIVGLVALFVGDVGTNLTGKGFVQEEGQSPLGMSISCDSIGNNGVITEKTTLTSDIVAWDSPCLRIGVGNVVLDCAGFTVSGQGNVVGVAANGVSNAVVKNCNFVGFIIDLHFGTVGGGAFLDNNFSGEARSEEHTSELQSR